MPEDAELRLALLEQRFDRMVSDAESEKGTRSRTNERIFSEFKEVRREQKEHQQSQDDKLTEIRKEQQKTTRILYMGMGGLGLATWLLTYLRDVGH